ncbi:MAG: signal peptidase II [Bacteroidota bacterium]
MRVLWLSLAIILADQVTKMLAKFQLEPLGRSVQVIGDLFKFTYTENPGMAFGLEIGSKLFLTLFSIVATILILVYLWHVRKAPLGYRLALAFVLGGAFGNVIDRVFFGMTFGECFPSPPGSERLFYGCVIDFLHVDVGVLYIPDWVPFLEPVGYPLFPIGNIADVCIIIGVVLVLFTQGSFQRYIEGQSGSTPSETPPPPSGESVDPTPAV